MHAPQARDARAKKNDMNAMQAMGACKTNNDAHATTALLYNLSAPIPPRFSSSTHEP